MNSAGKRGRRLRRSRVTAALAQRAVAGIVPGDHVCASFGSDEEQQAIVGRYARQALRRGERLLYLAHASDDDAIRGCLEDEGIDVVAGLALGQIEIRRVEHERQTIDPDALVAALQADRRAALRDGYSALCTTSEMSWTITQPGELDVAIRYERSVNRVFATADVAGLCQYDRRLFAPEPLERLVATHEFHVHTEHDLTTTARRRLTISERADGVVAVAGALDIDSATYLGVRLGELDGDEDLVVLTSGIGFADIAGCRALVRAAESLGHGRRMVLPDAAPALVRVLKLCGWSELGPLVLS